MVRTLLVLSAARSGTTALGDILGQSPDCEWAGEIFNGHARGRLARRALDYVQANQGLRLIGDEKDFRLVNPELIPEFASRFVFETSTRVFAFKVLAGQADFLSIERLMRHEQVTTIVPWRNPVDVYISNQKAIAFKKWSGLDQTNYRPHLNAPHFLKWYAMRQRFMEFLCENADYIAGKILYEDVFPRRGFRRKRLEKALRSAGVVLEDIGSDTRFTKQDLNRKPQEKVFNWDHFVGELGPQAELLSGQRERQQLSCIKTL